MGQAARKRFREYLEALEDPTGQGCNILIVNGQGDTVADGHIVPTNGVDSLFINAVRLFRVVISGVPLVVGLQYHAASISPETVDEHCQSVADNDFPEIADVVLRDAE